MQRAYYRYRNLYANGILGWILLINLSILMLFYIVWLLPDSDKTNYKNYKQYEAVFDGKLKAILDEVSQYNILYNENKLTKDEIIDYYESSANKLDMLYDEFKWDKGDAVTKELYTIKKQIIINYSQLYTDKAKSVEKGILSNENEYLNYITSLIEHYNIKDKLQKEKFKLKF